MDLPTFVMALLALVVAVLSLGWQIASWAFDGRRVRVSLRYGMRVEGGVVAAPLRKDGTPLDLSSAYVPGGLGHEVIGIQVSNMSRTARVRVESIAATVEGGPSFDPQGTAIGDPLPRWLEPGETNSWYMDAATAKQLVHIMRGAGKNVDRVRMVASISPGIAAETPEQLVVPES